MTIADVARRAKVSTATVSRVLNDLAVVKESTRKRVLQAAAELNYTPNLHARSLAGGRTKALGVVVSNLSNPFFIDIFQGLEAAARAKGYLVMVEHTDYRVSQLIASARSLIGRQVSGLALIVSEVDRALLDEISSSGVRLVVYDVGEPGPSVTNIRVRYELGMRRVVHYLHTLGHRRMAFVGHHTSLGPLQVRKKAFLESVAQFGGEVESRIVPTSDTPAGGMQAAHELMLSGFNPTAIVCVNDCIAFGVLRKLRSQGLSVPGDVSVTGFDNIEFSEFTNPALTTVDIPRRSIGKMAAEALLKEQPEAGRPAEIVIEPELVLRDSTGPVRSK